MDQHVTMLNEQGALFTAVMTVINAHSTWHIILLFLI